MSYNRLFLIELLDRGLAKGDIPASDIILMPSVSFCLIASLIELLGIGEDKLV